MDRITVEMAPGRSDQPLRGACPQGCKSCVFSTEDRAVFGEYTEEQMEAFGAIQERFRLDTVLIIPPQSSISSMPIKHAPRELGVIGGKFPQKFEELDPFVSRILDFAHDLIQRVLDRSGASTALTIGAVIPPLVGQAEWNFVRDLVDTILSRFITVFEDRTPSSFRLALDINDLPVDEFARMVIPAKKDEIDVGFRDIAELVSDDPYSTGYVQEYAGMLSCVREFYLHDLPVSITSRIMQRLKDREQVLQPIMKDDLSLGLFPGGVWVGHSVKNRLDDSRWLTYKDLYGTLRSKDPIEAIVALIEGKRKL